MKKILICLLVLLTVLPAAVSCRQGENPRNETKSTNADSATTPKTSADTEDPYADGVPEDLRFDGRTFVMTGPTPDGYRFFYQEEDSSEPVDSAVYKRNKLLEERFGIEIYGMELGYTDNHADAFSSYALAEDDVIDVLGIGFYQSAASMITSGYAVPWNNVKYINLDKQWWNKSVSETLAILGNYYYLSGDINWNAMGTTSVFFFNKKVAGDNSELVGDIYETVRKGEWTQDLLMKYVKAYSRDNGDGIWDSHDYYGLVQNGHTFPSYGCNAGIKTVLFKDNGVDIDIMNDKLVSIVEYAHSLVCDPTLTFWRYTTDELSPIFFADRALFMNSVLGDCQWWREYTSDFGIIPLPKYNEEQEDYISYSDQWGLVLALPCTASDTDRTGAVLEAMAALSRKYVVPAYYDITLNGRWRRDDESEEMLDIIFANIFYDPGMAYVNSLDRIPVRACLSAGNGNLSSWYYANESVLYENYYNLYNYVKGHLSAG